MIALVRPGKGCNYTAFRTTGKVIAHYATLNPQFVVDDLVEHGYRMIHCAGRWHFYPQAKNRWWW